jgi:hypothetical protein
MDTAKELKLTYKFEWDKKMSPPEVEIDPPEESVVVDLKKPIDLIPCWE